MDSWAPTAVGAGMEWRKELRTGSPLPSAATASLCDLGHYLPAPGLSARVGTVRAQRDGPSALFLLPPTPTNFQLLAFVTKLK